MKVVAEDDMFPIGQMVVAVKHRGQGVGRGLLDMLLSIADNEDKTAVLDVYEQTAAAVRLYESAGFETAEKYMHHGSPTLVMVRPKRGVTI